MTKPKTTMKLSEQQQLFTKLIAKLINYADEHGWGLTFGDAYRDARLFGEFGEKRAYSAANSVHKVRLAVDFNLFIEGRYRSDTAAYTKLGEYWESLHPLCRWGGRWQDGNHFSMEYQGFK